MDANVEVYVEGEWLTISAPDVFNALCSSYAVDHPRLGHMVIVPRSFPMRDKRGVDV